MTPVDRPKHAMSVRRVESAAELARRVGVKEGTVRQHMNRGDVPKSAAGKYARALQITTDWLLFGRGPGPEAKLEGRAAVSPSASGFLSSAPPIVTVGGDEYGGVSRWPMSASAGPGVLVPPDAKPMRFTLFRMEWLRQVTNAPLEELAVLEIHGASMHPLLMHGDVALVDLTVHQVHADGVYVLQLDDTQIVKKASVGEHGKLTIASLNPTFPTLTDVDPTGVLVIGRVFWIGRQL